MSKGPGLRQREILRFLEAIEAGCCWLTDVLHDGYTASEYQATYRAANKLHEAGRIEVVRFMYGKEKVALYLPGRASHRTTINPLTGATCEATDRPPDKCLVRGNLRSLQHLPESVSVYSPTATSCDNHQETTATNCKCVRD